MYTLKLKHHFDAAHKLDNYQGACSNIHGHRWDVEVIIKAKSLQANEMLIDFKELKSIINHLDHTLILRDCEENNELIKTVTFLGLKQLLIGFKPTAENIAKYLQIMIQKASPDSAVIVTVWESPNASITYED